MCRFRLHKFRSFVDLFTISSMCWLKESLLSRITPRYLSDLTSSRTMEFDESELSMFQFNSIQNSLFSTHNIVNTTLFSCM